MIDYDEEECDQSCKGSPDKLLLGSEEENISHLPLFHIMILFLKALKVYLQAS